MVVDRRGLPERPYRFRIDVEGHEFQAAAGDFDGLAVVDFTIREVDGGRFGLVDDRGDREWTFSAPNGDLVESISDVVAGVPTVVWTRWNGERFVRADTPWSVGDRVEFATVNGAMLALVSAPGRRSII